MSSVETYYLIDFENVHEAGLSGFENLGTHDHVHLFSTKNAPKISIEILPCNLTNLSPHIVPVGNQSLDMHLVSYLGYLIGQNANDKYKYVIISQDSGYDNIISFWKKQNGSDIARRNKIAVTQKEISPKAANTPKSITAIGTSNTKKKTATASNAKKKTQFNSEVQRALSKARYKQSVINSTASIAAKYYGKSHFADNVKNELLNAYSNGAEVYEIVSPIITKYSTPQTQNTNATTQLNSQIQKLLSRAGFPNDIINPIASLVSKHYKEQNGKQTIYTAIIAKYGQRRGLNIYNHIKNSF